MNTTGTATYATTNNAVIRILCDQAEYYFLGEYVIPSNSSSVKYKPGDLEVAFDMTNAKSSVPQFGDYFFDLELNILNHQGWIFFAQGLGNVAYGIKGWSANPPDTRITDPMFAIGDYSVLSTSIFRQPHPVGFLGISKSYPQNSLNLRGPFNIQNPFGLALQIIDSTRVVQVQNGYWAAYYALFPSEWNFYNPSTWGVVYSSYQSQITTTSEVTSTTALTSSSTLQSSTSAVTSELQSSSSYPQRLIVADYFPLLGIAMVIAVVAVVGYYMLRKRVGG
jgi:hypothetical protein